MLIITGKCLYFLINQELLPEHYRLSEKQKESLFQFIMKELPVEERAQLLPQISNHDDIPLNQYLWPKPKYFVLFSTTPTLPIRWVNEMNAFLAEESNLEKSIKKSP